MKTYKKLASYFFLSALLLASLVGCSDDKEINYLDDGAYPAPKLEMTTPTDIEVVQFESLVTVVAKSKSEIGLRNIYLTQVRETEEGYEEIDHNKRVNLKIDTLEHNSSLEFEMTIKINYKDAVGVKLVATDVLTKSTSKVVKFGFLKGVPPELFAEPTSLPEVQPNEVVAVSLVAKSHIGLKSVRHTLIQKQPYKELHPVKEIPITVGSKLEDFVIEVAIDNMNAEAIKVIAEDADGTITELIIDIEGIEGVVKSTALIFDNIEMAPEWEQVVTPTQPYLFSFDGINIGGQVKNVLSLADTKSAGAGSVDFAFVNIWRNKDLVVVANRGFGFVGADRLNGGPIARQTDIEWITPVVRNKMFFNIIPQDMVTAMNIDDLFNNAQEDFDTYLKLDAVSALVKDNGNTNNLLMQRINASSNKPADVCNLQIEDGTYIAFYRGGVNKYGIIKVIEAADDSEGLVDGCKIGTVTTGKGTTTPYIGPDLAGFDYTGATKLYGKKCKLKIIVQK